MSEIRLMMCMTTALMCRKASEGDSVFGWKSANERNDKDIIQNDRGEAQQYQTQSHDRG